MPIRHAARIKHVARLTDPELIGALALLVGDDRHVTAKLLVHMAEVDARKPYLEQACNSMHVYCVERLHMSDHEAFRRIHAARAARRYPRIFEMVARNELHLSALALLSQHLTEENHRELLSAAVHRTKRQIQHLLAQQFPQPDVPTLVRRLPQPAPQSRPSRTVQQDAAPEPPTPLCQPSRPIVAPTAPERYKIQFTASAGLHEKLREAQDLLRRQVPNGDLAEIFERGLDALLKEAKKKRFGATERPRAQKPLAERTRHIPNAVKRAVIERDRGQCTFLDTEGNRCTATSLIEFHHINAYARGGAHSVDNITLRCAPHNRLEADKELGKETVAAKIREARTNTRAANPPGKSTLLAPGELRERHKTYAVAHRVLHTRCSTARPGPSSAALGALGRGRARTLEGESNAVDLGLEIVAVFAAEQPHGLVAFAQVPGDRAVSRLD